MKPLPQKSRPHRGFSLVEVTLAIGIVGIAILSLVGILGSTFQQVDDIIQTNRALSGVSRLIGALDNPRSIVYLDESDSAANTKYIHQAMPALDPNSTTLPASNFDIAYRLLFQAKTTSAEDAIWLYVYERKILSSADEVTASTTTVKYNVNANPSVMEVAFSRNHNFTPAQAATRNVMGVPMRVRLSLSKLLIGQRYVLDDKTLEPTSAKWEGTGSQSLPRNVYLFPLAYLPVIAEFYPHDYSDFTVFSKREESPILVQNIVISR